MLKQGPCVPFLQLHAAQGSSPEGSGAQLEDHGGGEGQIYCSLVWEEFNTDHRLVWGVRFSLGEGRWAIPLSHRADGVQRQCCGRGFGNQRGER